MPLVKKEKKKKKKKLTTETQTDKIHREETKESQSRQEKLTGAFRADQWCDCRPRVLEDGHAAGLTLNDLKTNVCNKQTHTEKEAGFFAPGALLSAPRTCQKSTRTHLCTRACECACLDRDVGENKLNAS